MIDQLVTQVAERLGVDKAMAERGVGVMLGLLKEKASGQPALAKLFATLDGAEALADQFPGEDGGATKSGGLMGGLLGQAAGMLGGDASDAVAAMAAFQKTGFSIDQAKDMMPVVKSCMEEHVGSETVEELTGSIPMLKSFLG